MSIVENDILADLQAALESKRAGTADSDVNVFNYPIQCGSNVIRRAIAEIENLRSLVGAAKAGEEVLGDFRASTENRGPTFTAAEWRRFYGGRPFAELAETQRQSAPYTGAESAPPYGRGLK